jgi:putative DNA methylase
MTVSSHPVISPKKLIEVALPLDAINEAAAREKSIRHGHPSTLHLWWARRPLAAARAVIFGQLVHDPEDLWRCQNPGKEPVPQNKAAWTKARTRLFKIIEDLVLWENTTNETVLNAAREAIRESWRQTCELNKHHPQAAELFNPDKMPGLHDPFAGGGAIPLEAQRLGLDAYASDLNPVAVLINKAMIEIPPKFAGRAPVHPSEGKTKQLIAPEWKGAAGLADDVRHYGQWMRDEAEKRIGHLYPKVTITKEMAVERPDLKPLVGEELTVIAWLWARTVKSPNPAYAHVDVPLASSFVLSSKEGKEAYVQPVVEKDGYRFTVKVGKPPEGATNGTKLARANFGCLLSSTPIPGDYIKSEGMARRMGAPSDGDSCRGPTGSCLSFAISGTRRDCSERSPVVETRRGNCKADDRWQLHAVWPHNLRRPLHPAAAGGPDDLQRSRRRGPRVHPSRRHRRRPARRRHSP